MTEEKYKEQIEILKKMIDIKDNIINDKNQQIERLESKIRFAYSTIGKINKSLKDFDKQV